MINSTCLGLTQYSSVLGFGTSSHLRAGTTHRCSWREPLLPSTTNSIVQTFWGTGYRLCILIWQDLKPALHCQSHGFKSKNKMGKRGTWPDQMEDATWFIKFRLPPLISGLVLVIISSALFIVTTVPLLMTDTNTQIDKWFNQELDKQSSLDYFASVFWIKDNFLFFSQYFCGYKYLFITQSIFFLISSPCLFAIMLRNTSPLWSSVLEMYLLTRKTANNGIARIHPIKQLHNHAFHQCTLFYNRIHTASFHPRWQRPIVVFHELGRHEPQLIECMLLLRKAHSGDRERLFKLLFIQIWALSVIGITRLHRAKWQLAEPRPLLTFPTRAISSAPAAKQRAFASPASATVTAQTQADKGV